MVQSVILIFFTYDDTNRRVVAAFMVLRLLRLLRLARFVQVSCDLLASCKAACSRRILTADAGLSLPFDGATQSLLSRHSLMEASLLKGPASHAHHGIHANTRRHVSDLSIDGGACALGAVSGAQSYPAPTHAPLIGTGQQTVCEARCLELCAM